MNLDSKIAMGIDISPKSIAWGRNKLGLELRNKTLEDLDEPEGSFDVITMIDLIEHDSKNLPCVAKYHDFVATSHDRVHSAVRINHVT